MQCDAQTYIENTKRDEKIKTTSQTNKFYYIRLCDCIVGFVAVFLTLNIGFGVLFKIGMASTQHYTVEHKSINYVIFG